MPDQTVRLTDLDSMAENAECLRTIAHPRRLRILQILSQGEHPVGVLAESCELPSAMLSEHLRLMQRCRLLHGRRKGRSVYYFIVDSPDGRWLAGDVGADLWTPIVRTPWKSAAIWLHGQRFRWSAAILHHGFPVTLLNFI